MPVRLGYRVGGGLWAVSCVTDQLHNRALAVTRLSLVDLDLDVPSDSDLSPARPLRFLLDSGEHRIGPFEGRVAESRPAIHNGHHGNGGM